MNTFAFFMEYFGRFLLKRAGDDLTDTERVLTTSFTNRAGKPQRLAAGWAVISPRGSRLQLDIPAAGVVTAASGTRFEAFAAALRDPLPAMLLTFDKKPLGVDRKRSDNIATRHTGKQAPESAQLVAWDH